MPDHSFQRQSGSSKESLLDRAIDTVKPQPGPPPRPHAPAVDKNAWEKSVDQTHVVHGLTVHDEGLSVYGETRSFHDRPGSNESIHVARQKVAHAIMNDAELSQRTGKARNAVHPPIEPRHKERLNSEERRAYESSLRAAREAYLSGHDPTNGAIYLNSRPTPDRSNRKFPHGSPKGVELSTQSGPYNNTFPNREVPSRTVWLNTYLPDDNDKKMPKKR